MSKLTLGIFIGILIGAIVFSGVAFGARKYVGNREPIITFSEESLPILNQILRDMWNSIDKLDDRVAALEP